MCTLFCHNLINNTDMKNLLLQNIWPVSIKHDTKYPEVFSLQEEIMIFILFFF